MLSTDKPELVASHALHGLLRAQVLQKAISLTDQEAEPKNEEASRVLKFFMSTLLNGSMKPPQPLDRMRSLTTVRCVLLHCVSACKRTFITRNAVPPTYSS